MRARKAQAELWLRRYPYAQKDGRGNAILRFSKIKMKKFGKTHASRTRSEDGNLRAEDFISSGGRVSNAWVTCLIQGDNSWKRLLIPHKTTAPHGAGVKTPVV